MPDHRNHAERALDNTLRSMRRSRLKRERESMTADQVLIRMQQIIRDRLQRDGETAQISLDDFRCANLPMDIVPGLFRSALAAVQRKQVVAGK